MKEIFQRTFTGISLIVLLPGSIIWGAVPFLAILLLFYTIGALELVALDGRKRKTGDWLVFASGFLLISATGLGLLYQLNPLVMVIPVILWIPGYFLTGDKKIPVLILLWLTLPLSSYFATAWLSGNPHYYAMLPLLIIILVWVNDIFAYLGGNLFGKHHLTPRLSPGKTYEGTITGVLASIIAGLLISRLTGMYSTGIWILVSFLSSILCLAGDLFESSLKRNYGVKDTGKILPGHGGVLDRFDSLLFVAPVTFVTLLIYHLLI